MVMVMVMVMSESIGNGVEKWWLWCISCHQKCFNFNNLITLTLFAASRAWVSIASALLAAALAFASWARALLRAHIRRQFRPQAATEAFAYMRKMIYVIDYSTLFVRVMNP
jgi:hypothetical protein